MNMNYIQFLNCYRIKKLQQCQRKTFKSHNQNFQKVKNVRRGLLFINFLTKAIIVKYCLTNLNFNENE